MKDEAYILMFHKVNEHVACLLYGPLNLLWTERPSGVFLFLFLWFLADCSAIMPVSGKMHHFTQCFKVQSVSKLPFLVS